MSKWTAAEDAAIIAAKGEGMSWAKISASISRGARAVTLHAYTHLGFTPQPVVLATNRKAVLRRARCVVARGEPMPIVHDWREPFHAGHPATWGVICTQAYPAYVRER